MSRTKMTRETVPEGFTLSLAVVDALPVLCFGGSMTAAGLLFNSGLFLLGAFLCLFAGAAKVLWKIIVVLKKKNVWWLFLQMRILMPVGMLLMLTALIINRSQLSMAGFLSGLCGMPQLVFFAAGFIGMILMMVFAFKLDSSDPKANWIEQLTNGIAQACFLTGLLVVLLK